MVNLFYGNMRKEDFDKTQFFADLDSYIGAGINPVSIRHVVSFGLFNQEELAVIYQKLESGFVSTLRRCFPEDSFNYLKGMYFTAQKMSEMVDIPENITIKECIDSLEPDGFIDSILSIDKGETIKTEECKNYFRRYLGDYRTKENGHPEEDKITKKILRFIYERFISGAKENNDNHTSQAVEMAKVIAYLLKAREGTHYHCESELEAVSNFSLKRLEDD